MGWLTSYFQETTSGWSNNSRIRDSEPCGTHELLPAGNQRSVTFFLLTQSGIKPDSQAIFTENRRSVRSFFYARFGIKQGSQPIFDRNPTVSQIVHMYGIRDQAGLTVYFRQKSNGQSNSLYVRDSGSSGTHNLFSTENRRLVR